MESCRNVEGDNVLIASLLATQPWLDGPELTWKAIVTVDGDIAHGSHVAQSLIDQAWAVRHDFLSASAKPVNQALEEALSMGSPYVIADIGDATNGGSLGDSTQVLRAAIASQLKGSVILSITDPAGVLACQKNFSGKTISLTIGSGPEGSYNQKTEILGTIKGITNRKIAYTHPAALNTIDDPGLAALIEVSHASLNLLIVLHSNPVRVIDPTIYELFDLDLSQFDVLQAKSHVSFIAGFSRVTPNYILADTLGPTAADLKTLPFKKRPRPLYPFERI
jgi:microcystin degradation protein MlrC